MISFAVNPLRLAPRPSWGVNGSRGKKRSGGLDLANWRKSKKGAQATQVDGPLTAQCPASRVSDRDLVCSSRFFRQAVADEITLQGFAVLLARVGTSPVQ